MHGINRADFLKLCQMCAVLPDGVLGIKRDVPESYLVKVDGVKYYPVSYQMKFDKDGTPLHVAIVHDLCANSELYCNLERVVRLCEE